MTMSQIERELQQQKLEDQTWEDQIDVCDIFTMSSIIADISHNAYKQMPVSYPSHLFRRIPSSESRLPAPPRGVVSSHPVQSVCATVTAAVSTLSDHSDALLYLPTLSKASSSLPMISRLLCPSTPF
jgi:hypothetical protein